VPFVKEEKEKSLHTFRIIIQMNITKRKIATEVRPISSYTELLSYSNHPKAKS